MIVNIRGLLISKKPSKVIIDVGGLGYECLISTNTYDQLPNINLEVKLLTYFNVTENSQLLFGFSDEAERKLFKMLIGVSGIGPKTAIILLSSITPEEFKRRLIAGEVNMLTALPGIGPKTARRIIVELKDKFVKLQLNDLPKEGHDYSLEYNDAYDALMALGFRMQDVKKEIDKTKNKGVQMSSEEIIKEVLTKLQ